MEFFLLSVLVTDGVCIFEETNVKAFAMPGAVGSFEEAVLIVILSSKTPWAGGSLGMLDG